MGDQDHAYKILFGHERLIEDLLRGFLPEKVLGALDFASLERVKTDFLAEDTSGETRERRSDMVWKVRLKGGGEVFVYLMLEFQSTIDRWMALRVLTYTALLLEDLVRHGHVMPDGKLPTVLPFVIYNGEPAWTASDQVAELFAEVPGMEGFLAGYRPQLKYFLIDEGRLRDSELDRPGNITAALFRIESSKDPAQVHAAMESVAKELAGPKHTETRRSLALWLRRVLFSKGWESDPVQYAESLENVMTLLEAAQERWWNQAQQEGRKLGKRQGEATIVLKQLQLKFGALDSSTRSRVRSAEPADLERWAQRLLTAGSLDEVFS